MDIIIKTIYFLFRFLLMLLMKIEFLYTPIQIHSF
jgi:hypothetical protein